MMVDIGLKFLSAPSPPRGVQGHGLRIFIKSQGRSFCVKVYKTSYFEDPSMDFIHIWHDCRYRFKVFISTIPTLGVTLGSRSQTSNFHKNVRVKVFVLKFMTSYFEDPLMDFIHIWHDGRYRSKVFISTIPTPGMTLGSRSRT